MAIPTDGLIFYAPLAEDKATAETGQTLNYTGNFQFNIVSGIPCAVFSGEEKISVDNSNYFSGDFSISCWFRLTTPMAEGVVNAAVFVFGTTRNWFTIRANASGIFMNLGGQSNTILINIDTSSFNNITVTYSSSKLSIYINGLLNSQVSLDSLPNSSTFLIGDSGYSDWFTGEIASFRIYSKVLNTSEISALYNEFNEDSGGSGSCNTGFLIDGLFLSSSKPEQNQKGIIINNNFFIPLVEKGEFDAGVVVDVDGVSKVQPLAFDGLTPSASGSTEDYVAKVYATGMSEPDYIGEIKIEGSTFYRCASVDTSTKTWTGYRAVLNDGIYTFEDAVTTGLSYTSVTPQVGKIYSQDASVGVNYLSGQAPTYGLKFYASLKNSFTPETGQEFHSSLCVNLDQVEFANSSGIPGVVFPASETHAFYDAVENYTAPMSVSYWAKSGGNDNYVTLRRDASNSLSTDNGAIHFTLTGQDIRTTEAQCSTFITSETNTTDAWHHYCYTQSLTTARLYKGGILLNEQTYSFQYTSGRIYLSISSSGGGMMSSVRIYNRELTEEEVQLLASEFTPTQENA